MAAERAYVQEVNAVTDERGVPSSYPRGLLTLGAVYLIAASLGLASAPMRADAAAAVAEPASPNDTAPSCFFRRQWNGSWKASADARTIYIDVSGTIYRLDLHGPYTILRDPWATLINTGSSNTICSPLDLRLTVSNQVGIQQWPIVKSMARLSPEEAAELPKDLRPGSNPPAVRKDR